MRSVHSAAALERLRRGPLWKLIASDNAPSTLALLRVLLHDRERVLPASAFHERLRRELDALNATGANLTSPAETYAAGWLAEGWLERRLAEDAAEESYELSAASITAIGFVESLERRRSRATESRLAVVLDALERLAEETDPDAARRILKLEAERARIDREIAAIGRGELDVLDDERALERAREIIALTDGLTADFRQVRDEFARLGSDLRAEVLDESGSRGEVLDALFAGIDLIADSDAGRSFGAFWRLLIDPERRGALDEALDAIDGRGFASSLARDERRHLTRLASDLLAEGGEVHGAMQGFARSLKSFVRSREYLEHRRLTRLLADAQLAARAIRDDVSHVRPLGEALTLSSARIRSPSQWRLHDPSLRAAAGGMPAGDAPTLDVEALGELVAASEIDFRTLREDIEAALEERSPVSIGDVLARSPARQGLGSVVGLVALGGRHGTRTDEVERVAWAGRDAVERSARIPTILFDREGFAAPERVSPI